MHPAAGWSFRHRRTVLTGWPPPYSPAEAGQMNASRTVASVRAPGPGHRHHLDRHRHSQDRAHLTPPDHSAREGPDQRTDIKMTKPTDNELRPLSRNQMKERK